MNCDITNKNNLTDKKSAGFDDDLTTNLNINTNLITKIYYIGEIRQF